MKTTTRKPLSAGELTPAYAYIRVSTGEQRDEGFSLPAQKRALQAYAKNHGMLVVGFYSDEGISGGSIEGRPGIQQVLKDAEKGGAAIVLVWKVNRLSRKLSDLEKIADTLSDAGVALRSITEPFETETPAGRLNFQVMGAIGQFERSTLKENVRLGMRERAMEGLWNGGACLGYRSKAIPSTKRKRKETRLEVVPEEAAVVHHIFELYANGRGLKAIANALNHGGYRTKRGGMFQSVGIGEILDNPVYIGKIRFGVRGSGGGRQEDAAIVEQGVHEPIVTEDLWERVRALRAVKAKRPKRVCQRGFPLTGLLRCPACGYGMSMSRTSNINKDGSKRILHYYACGRWKNKGTAACHFNGVRADVAEAEVFRRLEAIVTHPRLLRDVVTRVNAQRRATVKPAAERLKAVTKRIETLHATTTKYLHQFERDAISGDVLASRLREIEAEVAQCESEATHLRAEMELGKSTEVSFEDVQQALNRVSDLLKAADSERQRAILQALIGRITLTDTKDIGSIEIHLTEDVRRIIGDTVADADAPPVALAI